MIAICQSNEEVALPDTLRGFAFTQDKNGRVDLTVGKRYTVYGIRKNRYGAFYLVSTDTVNVETPWWMPVAFFSVEDKRIPSSWIAKRVGSEQYWAAEPYFIAEEEIEDGTDAGKHAFELMRRMNEP